MTSEFAAAREFVRGAARYHDLVYIISKGKVLLNEDISHAIVIAVDQGQWADVVDTAWDSTAIAVARLPSEKLIVVGEDGDVVTYTGGVEAREKISPKPVMIRHARRISDYVYACGMKRQVYKRVDEGVWSDIGAPFPGVDEEVGFESIDGFNYEEVYAVGWNGEIWEFDGYKWIRRGSPTNVILTSVCCAPNGVVYAAGQQGIMIKGRHDVWESVEWEDEVAVDFWDLCWFEDDLYIATMTDLYKLRGNTLIEVDFGIEFPPSCYSLTSEEGVLWSIGRDQVASYDGRDWKIYD